MKKIMFSRKYGLEQAVIAKTKDKTRREAHLPDGLTHSDLWHPTMGIDDKGKVYFTFDCIDGKQRDLYPQYQVGEVLAVAQTYEQIKSEFCDNIPIWAKIVANTCNGEPGYYNKMFVRADLMPHAIRITDISIERLQDISDEDCMREGVVKLDTCTDIQPFPEYFVHDGDGWMKSNTGFDGFWTPQDAFASLIDRISGKGTWQRNPWTWAYEFELIR